MSTYSYAKMSGVKSILKKKSIHILMFPPQQTNKKPKYIKSWATTIYLIADKEIAFVWDLCDNIRKFCKEEYMFSYHSSCTLPLAIFTIFVHCDSSFHVTSGPH